MLRWLPYVYRWKIVGYINKNNLFRESQIWSWGSYERTGNNRAHMFASVDPALMVSRSWWIHLYSQLQPCINTFCELHKWYLKSICFMINHSKKADHVFQKALSAVWPLTSFFRCISVLLLWSGCSINIKEIRSATQMAIYTACFYHPPFTR